MVIHRKKWYKMEVKERKKETKKETNKQTNKMFNSIAYLPSAKLEFRNRKNDYARSPQRQSQLSLLKRLLQVMFTYWHIF